jgi:predicted nucleic acid-binding Zn ribbon protein
MPTYEYKCDLNSEHKFVEIRGITESVSQSTCAEEGCEGRLLRIFNAPPITFKGPGFQRMNG